MSSRTGALAGLALGIFGLATAATARDLVIPPVTYPAVPAQAATPEGFAPAGWRIERRIEGDLDGDGLDDLVLILRDADPRNVLKNDGLGPPSFDSNPRILVIALRRPQGGYGLLVADHALIPRDTEPNIEDYLEDAAPPTVRRGVLRLGLHLFANAGGSDMSQIGFSFRHDDGRMRLIGYDNHTVNRMSGETEGVSVDYLSGKVKQTKGRIDRDKVATSWITLPPAPPLTLEQVGDGMDFDPLHPPR